MNLLFRVLLTWAASSVFAIVAHADTFTVSTISDSGSGSLRQAILDANLVQGSCEAQTIVFDIPGSEVHTIQPLSELPPFEITITLDGYTQPGASVNTLREGDNAQLRIELDGSLAGDSHGLSIAPSGSGSGFCGGSGSIVRGVAINRFGSAGIYALGTTCQQGLSCGVGGIIVVGDFIGTDVTGTAALGNGTGVEFDLNTSRNIVGDQIVSDGGPNEPFPENRNVISGNGLDGVYLSSTDATVLSLEHRIRNNYIGVDASGTLPLPNGRHGVFADIGSSATKVVDNLITAHPSDGVRIAGGAIGFTDVVSNGIGVGIGGVALGNAGDGVHVSTDARGVTVGGDYYYLRTGAASIANNAGAGLFVDDASSVDARAGSIGNNGGLGIDLAPRGVNANDDQDPDSGPNELLNTPILTSLTFDSGTSNVSLDGTLNTTPNVSAEIHFYQNDVCDPSGFGESQMELGSINVTTDSGGNVSFDYQTQLSAGVFVTALTRRFASDPDDSTFIVSELSNCLRVGGETIFANGFDG